MAISRNAITLRVAGGGSLTLALNAGTRFKFHGAPARRAVARPGAQVAVTHAADAPATVVNVLKRAGA
jgi:spore coat protein U-like protein